MSVHNYKTTWCHIPEVNNFTNYSCTKLKLGSWYLNRQRWLLGIQCTGLLSWCTCTSFIIRSVFFLTTGPKPLPKRFLHILRSRASSFKWEYSLLSFGSSSSFRCTCEVETDYNLSPYRSHNFEEYSVVTYK
jgi:hypothetical protein